MTDTLEPAPSPVRAISWGDGKGRAAGIDDTGALLVETEEGRLDVEPEHVVHPGLLGG
jgi:biotin-(acetyl-CoA carboxylase) ligase